MQNCQGLNVNKRGTLSRAASLLRFYQFTNLINIFGVSIVNNQPKTAFIVKAENIHNVRGLFR
jgi:hypothetical protein